VALLGVDIANGKIKQVKENISTIVIEENGSDYIEPIMVHDGAEEVLQGSGEVPRDIDEPEHNDPKC
jgi:hypothetical protein